MRVRGSPGNDTLNRDDGVTDEADDILGLGYFKRHSKNSTPRPPRSKSRARMRRPEETPAQ